MIHLICDRFGAFVAYNAYNVIPVGKVNGKSTSETNPVEKGCTCISHGIPLFFSVG